MLDLQTGEWSTAFTGCKPAALCSGGSGRIFVQSQSDASILELDSTIPVFKGPIRTLHPGMRCVTMCCIPPLVDALVFSDALSSEMTALSVGRNELIWEFQEQMGERYHNPKTEQVRDRQGLFFYPEHNLLLVADGIRKKVLIVHPGSGHLIQNIDLPHMGHINALGLYNDQTVMLH